MTNGLILYKTNRKSNIYNLITPSENFEPIASVNFMLSLVKNSIHLQSFCYTPDIFHLITI